MKKLNPSAYQSNENLAWLIGYLLGDGYLTTGWVIGSKTKDTDLKDFEKKEAAKKMKVSQSTLQRILTSARKKAAEVLISGKAIKIRKSRL